MVQRAGALALLAAMLAPAPPASAQSVSLHNTVAPDAIRLNPVGAADPTKLLTMAIEFMPRNHAQLDALIAAQQDSTSPQYHQWLTDEEYTWRFGPTERDFNAVADWLTSSGFQITSGSRQEGLVRFSGTVAAVEKEFNARIMTFGDGSKFANMAEPEIPAAFAGLIGDIVGLENLGKSLPAWSWADHGYGHGGNTFAPPDLYTFYDETPLLNAGINGSPSNDCIAIYSLSDVFPSILNAFTGANGFTLAAIDLSYYLGPEGNPGVVSGYDVEAYLDIEWSHAVAPGDPQILYFVNPNSFSGEQNLQDGVGAAVNQNLCGAINISYAQCGDPPSFWSGTMDPIFSKAVAHGQSVFVASGDHGVDMCSKGVPNVNEMSADPNVTSVGGTEFVPNWDSDGNDVGFVAEHAWNDNNLAGNAGTNSATGGGKSQVFTSKPSWQKGQGVPNDGVRDVPDVAMVASPINPGLFVTTDNDFTNPPSDELQATQDGGTSVAAPMWAGISRLVQQMTGSRLGNMDPRIYQLANGGLSANGFRDVLTGNNNYITCTTTPPSNGTCPPSDEVGVVGYSAGPGYDLTTGWGTVDISTFANAYSANHSLRITPTKLSFPNTVIGARSNQEMVTVTNPKGSSNVLIEQVSTTQGFDQQPGCGGILPPGQSCVISEVFAPGLAKPHIGTLTISDSANGSPQSVTLSGTGVLPTLQITPTTLTFPNTVVGTSSPLETVTITNPTPGSPVTIENISYSTPTSFLFSGSTCGVLAPGASCKILVAFLPSAYPTQTETLTITDNAQHSPQKVSLTGTGVPPTLQIVPPKLTFPETIAGQSSNPLTVTLTAAGGPVQLESIATFGSPSSPAGFTQTNNCPVAGALAPGGSCAISVTFTPKAIAIQGQLLISDNASGNPQTVVLTGIGEIAILTAAPATLNFGELLANHTSAPKRVMLTNKGNLAAQIAGVTVLEPFKIATGANTCSGKTIKPDGTCSFDVEYAPTIAGSASEQPVDVAYNGTSPAIVVAGVSPPKIGPPPHL